jgi:hypothetical protein
MRTSLIDILNLFAATIVPISDVAPIIFPVTGVDVSQAG